MKQIVFYLLVLTSSVLFAQNQKPIVAIQNVSVDQTQMKVTIIYDLADGNNDPCEVWLKFSTDGDFYQMVSAVTGDVGTNISTGNSKTIIWDYSAFTGNIYTTQIRVYASDNQPIDIADIVAEIDSNDLKYLMGYVEGKRNVSTGLTHLNEIRDSIYTIFQRNGLKTENQSVSYSSYTGRNILGRKTGAKDEAITFIMDAHYDGVPISPAADDNGSGTCGVLAAVQALSKYDFEHSIRFIGFDFEEQGLVGSIKYVQNGIKPYEDIQGVLNYEMIGYYSNQPNSQEIPSGFNLLFPQLTQDIVNDSSRGNFLFVCGNTNSSSLSTLLVNNANQYVPGLRALKGDVPGNGSIAPDLRRSDHAPFWDSGKKALMLTDGADFRNNNYHTAADSSENLNFTFMTQIVQATVATMATLAVPISVGKDDFDLAVLTSLEHSHDFPAKISLYPNPTQGKLNLQIQAEKAFKTRIEIFDLTGKIVWTTFSDISQGNSIQTFDLSNLSEGSYILVLTSDDHSFSEGFLLKP